MPIGRFDVKPAVALLLLLIPMSCATRQETDSTALRRIVDRRKRGTDA